MGDFFWGGELLGQERGARGNPSEGGDETLGTRILSLILSLFLSDQLHNRSEEL